MAEESLPASRPEAPMKAEIQALVQRAQAGDPSGLPRLREILDGHPELWKHMGDLSSLVETAWIAALAAGHPLAVESMKRTIAEMKRELAGVRPSAVDRMLADQVVACWMEVKCMEGMSADSERATLAQAGLTLKRLESAQKRYLSAIKTLHALRGILPAEGLPSGGVKLYEEPERRQA